MRDRIRGLAGSSRSTEAPLRAEGRITRHEDGKFHLELVVHAGDLVGTRHIEGSSCADLTGAAAVALALLLRSPAPLREGELSGQDTTGGTAGDGSATNTPSEKERRTDEKRPPEQSHGSPGPVRPAAEASSDRPPPRRPWHGLIRAPLGAFALGPLPDPSFGLAVAGGVSFERWRFFVEASTWREQRMTASDEPGVGADVQLVAAGLRTSWALVQGGFELAPCVALTLEHLRAQGTGDEIAPRSADATWLAAGIGVQVRWRLVSWFGLFGGVSGQIEGSRPTITVDGVGTLGQTWPASLTVMVGPEWIL